MVISASLQACGVVFPFAMPTSICRSIVTICSGLYLLIGMTSYSSKWILSHSTWYKFCRSRHDNEVVLWSAAFIPIALQDPNDRNYCVPIPCRRWHTVQLVDLAKIADCLHVTTVHSKHELALRRYHPHQPLPV